MASILRTIGNGLYNAAAAGVDFVRRRPLATAAAASVVGLGAFGMAYSSEISNCFFPPPCAEPGFFQSMGEWLGHASPEACVPTFCQAAVDSVKNTLQSLYENPQIALDLAAGGARTLHRGLRYLSGMTAGVPAYLIEQLIKGEAPTFDGFLSELDRLANGQDPLSYVVDALSLCVFALVVPPALKSLCADRRVRIDPDLNPVHFEICGGFVNVPDPPRDASLQDLTQIALCTGQKIS